MSISTPFIRRPVATTLLSIGLVLLGFLAFNILPVASLPRVDFPTISVTAKQAGASPEVMAATVATPLERNLGRIAGVNEITSSSTLGSTRITLQFDLNRDINGAARDVQGAINASLSSLPSGLQNNPTYRKANPADAPVMILALTSKTLSRVQMYDAADTILGQKLLQIEGVGDVSIGGAAQPAVRVELNPSQLAHYGIGLDTVRSAITSTNANRPKGFIEKKQELWEVKANDQAKQAADYIPLIVSYKNGGSG
nr:efflux RND transporter permease subunit [Acinetobacter seifertii]